MKKYLYCAENIAHVPFLEPVAVLKCDYRGCVHKNVDHDVILRIPEGAIPRGECIHLEVAVALYGPFEFCENQRPISPILWICPQEDIAFLKPIEIILPHIVTKLTCEGIEHFGIKFTKASHEDYIVDGYGNKKYKFQSICEAKLEFTLDVNRSFGILRTNHCCFFCISAIQDHELTHELALTKGYCLTCVEGTIIPNPSISVKNVIYFCTSFLLKSCLKVSYQL